MTEPVMLPGDVPEAMLETRSRLSMVWLVPLVALVAGVYVAYRAITERGPAITIAFRDAEGLEAGKTKVKYKDVEVGEVEQITLAADLSGVVCQVRMAKGMGPHLNEQTQFWVVRARIAGGQASGLGTLLGGAYLGFEPGGGRDRKKAFQGLEVPPIVTAGVPGRHFRLKSHQAGHVAVGTPVFYRKVKVGTVVASKMAPSGESVLVEVFVDAPYDARVRRGTHFWNASGIDVSVGAAGIQVRTESLVSILIGGIAFDSPSDGSGEVAADDAEYTLYESYEATRRPVYTHKVRYLLYFPDQSLRGLRVGAPVEFRGIVVGEVTDLTLTFDAASDRFRIPVVVEIEPERFQAWGDDEQNRRGVLEKLVGAGFRGQLKSGSLLTGQLLVSFDMHKDVAPARIIWSEPYAELPTVPAPLDQITTDLATLARRLDTIPFERIGADLGGTLQQLNRVLMPRLSATLAQAEGTLASVGASSSVNAELRSALSDVAAAARALELTADELERHPESLLFGKGGKD